MFAGHPCRHSLTKFQSMGVQRILVYKGRAASVPLFGTSVSFSETPRFSEIHSSGMFALGRTTSTAPTRHVPSATAPKSPGPPASAAQKACSTVGVPFTRALKALWRVRRWIIDSH